MEKLGSDTGQQISKYQMMTHHCLTVVPFGVNLPPRGNWQCVEMVWIVRTQGWCCWHLVGQLCRMFSGILQYIAQSLGHRITWPSNAKVEKPCCRNVKGERVHQVEKAFVLQNCQNMTI